MNKYKNLLILCSGVCLVTGAMASALYEGDNDLGLVLRPSPLGNIGLGVGAGVEQRFTKKTPIGDSQTFTNHLSGSLDYHNFYSQSAWATMANYVVNHKKVYFAVGGGIAWGNSNFQRYSTLLSNAPTTNVCGQATIGYNFSTRKGIGVELRGIASPNKAFNGASLNLTLHF